MVQSKNAVHGIYAILGMSAIAALLMVGSGHVSVPLSPFQQYYQPQAYSAYQKQYQQSYNHPFDDNYNYGKYKFNHDDDDDDEKDDDDDRKKHKPSHYSSYNYYQPNYAPSYQPYHQPNTQSSLTLLKQEALNICASNIGDKNKIKLEAKDGALIEITCLIVQTQTAQQSPPIDPIQDAANICGANVKGKFTVKPSGNKIEIKAKDGAMIILTCKITQTQSFGIGDPLLIQKADNLCGSNVGSKNKLEIKAKDGSAVVINCEITQTQTVNQPQTLDPIQIADNICGTNIGFKNKIKIDAKDGSYVVINCQNNQVQSIGFDPLLSQESTNICGTNIGDKNKLEIKAKDGSAVIINCQNNQVQSIGI